MSRIQLNNDIKPLSEFRANVSTFIDQVNKTNRPLVITNHGKSAAVLLNVTEYESLIDKLELMQEIRAAQQEIKDGKGIPFEEVKKRLLKKFKR